MQKLGIAMMINKTADATRALLHVKFCLGLPVTYELEYLERDTLHF